MSPSPFVLALTLPADGDPAVAIAASRAGALGVLDCEYQDDSAAARRALAALATFGKGQRGVKVDAGRPAFMAAILDELSPDIQTVILARPQRTDLRQRVRSIARRGGRVLVEATDQHMAVAAAEAGAAGVILKGNEAGGRVGEETAFVLFQHCVGRVGIPLWVHGGVGPHTAAACLAGGAAGVVLDWQLALTRESALRDEVKARLASFDGSETLLVGQQLGEAYRVYHRPGLPAVESLVGVERTLAAATSGRARADDWRAAATEHFRRSAGAVLPMGQDAAFAARLARDYVTVGGVIGAIDAAATRHVQAAREAKPLDEGSPLAVAHGTRYPILQGPMTRVSDVAPFCEAVAVGGGLPFLALALMRGPQVERLLAETASSLAGRPWGVGVLGFVPPDLRQEQLEVVRRHRPPFAIIAGGRPDQAAQLEREGITTYLHTPSPGLLELFLSSGSRHFIFEGRECGGHVGPRSSFVLWQSMVDVLTARLDAGKLPAEECHVVFAGGIHDGRSAAMAAAIAGPLAARGVKVGVLMGTAYLFTREAVQSGAIVEGFQREALRCDHTVLLETGPGHAIRCVDTAYRATFEQRKRELLAANVPHEETRLALEEINLGRLRIASKGVQRHPLAGVDPSAPRYIEVSAAEQQAEGMYMIGQVAALHDELTDIAALHHAVSAGSTALLAATTPAEPEGAAAKACDVAVIGMSTILPGAPTLRQYWQNIIDKVDAIREVPADRWDADVYFDADRAKRDRIYSKWGGFLDPIPFDPLAYGMPPNTIPSIEPLQLLTLEATRAALEDAGYRDRPFDRERTAVILGAGGGASDLGQLYSFRSTLPTFFGAKADEVASQLSGALPEWTEDSFAGILMNVAAGRVANRFNLGGSNFTVDAACASSLAAVYLALRELESGASTMAVVGGVDTMQSPFAYLCFSKTQALSPRGRCRTFDESADGIAISEGLAMVVLKRLDDAERDGDRVYAVIKGAGSSSDGRDKGLTAPRPEGQARALERAYAAAGLSPATVGLIEAHGTGTAAGDRAEVEALTRFFGGRQAERQRCAIGSVKSMIGHTKCAAGVAGLIKVALALYHGVLPPTLGVEQPNRRANFPETPFYVNTEPRPWVRPPGGTPRRAGVSAFGFGGTNFHIVLEEYAGRYGAPEEAPFAAWPSELLLWAAPDRAGLLAAIAPLQRALAAGARPRLADVAFTTAGDAAKSGDGALRLSIVASGLDDLTKKLQIAEGALRDPDRLELSDPSGVYFSARPAAREGRVAFLYPGQGSQYPGMGKDLALSFSAARDGYERLDAVLHDRFGRPLSTFIYPPPAFDAAERDAQRAALTDTHVAQPALGATAIAAHRVLAALGVTPALAAGHSYGEFVALWAAGVWDEETLALLSEARGRFMKESAGAEPGAMAAVEADAGATAELIAGIAGVTCANMNAPKQTVISGTKAGVEAAVTACGARGVRARPLPVACAFHSPLVARARDRLAAVLAETALRPPTIPVYANTTGDAHAPDPRQIAALLADHLTRPVEFSREIEAMYRDGARLFVEVGPKGVLTGLVGRILAGRPHVAVATDGEGRGLATFLAAVGRLAAEGLPIDSGPLFAGRGVERLDFDALRAPGAKPSYTATTWLVDGARAIPSRDLAKPVPHPRVSIPSRGAEAAQAPDAARGAPTTADAGRRMERASAMTHTSQPPLGSDSSPGAMIVAPSTNGHLLPAAGLHVNGQAAAPLAAYAPTVSPLVAAPPRADVAGVIAQFQQVMGRFLDTQRAVMLAYLGGAPGQVGLAEAMAAGQATPRDVSIAAPPIVESPPPPSVASLAASLPATAPAPVAPPPTAPAAPAPREPAPPEPAPPEPALTRVTRETVEAQLLAIVSERTGYPPEMLGLDLDLEADLGVDSIKRVEVLGTLQQQLGDHAAQVESAMEQLAAIKTLRGIIDWVAQTAAGDPSPAAAVVAVASPQDASATATTPAAERTDDDAGIGRYLARLIDAPLPAERAAIAPGRTVLITDDGRGIAAALAARLRSEGRSVALVRAGSAFEQADAGDYTCAFAEEASARALVAAIRGRQGPVGGILHLLAARPWAPLAALDLAAWRERLDADVAGLFHLVRACAEDLHAASRAGGAAVIGLSGLGGALGAEGEATAEPVGGGVAGLLKTLALEWPDVRVRVVDVDPAAAAESLAANLEAELLTASAETEVGYRRGRRVALGPVRAPLIGADAPMTIDPSWTILLTGGARGITAEIAIDLARRYRPTLLLVGRSPLPSDAEDPATAALEDPRELKAALIARLRAAGEAPAPAAVERECRRLLQEREIRRTLREIEAAGAIGRYFQVDMRRERAVQTFLATVYEHYHCLDGVVHGAGVIEDKLIDQKDAESFDRVFGAKVDSAFLLARHLQFDTLRFLAFFASVSGRFGNRGQADYAAANEILNALARQLDQQHGTRVFAVNWGPWAAGGMVSPELARRFAENGVLLIPREVGARIFDREVRLGAKGQSQIIIGGGDALALRTQPTASAGSTGSTSGPALSVRAATPRWADDGAYMATIRLDRATDQYLADHTLDGKPVLPTAMAQELLLEHVAAGWAPLTIVRCRNLQVLKGVVLDGDAATLHLRARQASTPGDTVLVHAELRCEANQPRINFTLDVELGPAPAAPSAGEFPALRQPGPSPKSTADAYRDWLFHGERLAHIESIDVVGVNGLEAWLRQSLPARLIAGAPKGEWLLDPVLFDCALQLSLIWQRYRWDATGLPARYAALHRYASPKGGRVRCRVLVAPDSNATMFRADFAFWDEAGRLCWLVEGMECSSSKALNRLVGATAPRK